MLTRKNDFSHTNELNRNNPPSEASGGIYHGNSNRSQSLPGVSRSNTLRGSDVSHPFKSDGSRATIEKSQSQMRSSNEKESSETTSEFLEETDNRVQGNEITSLFDRAFSYSRLELDKLVDGSINTARISSPKSSPFGTPFGFKGLGVTEQSNQNALIQELKTALKTVMEEVKQLRENCIDVENKYKEVTKSAADELQKSMNILYKLQMKTASLDESERIQKKLSRDILSLRDRLAKKEKERRLIEEEVIEREKEIRMQNTELVTLRSMLGSGAQVSGEDGSRTSIEAKIEAQLRMDLSNAEDRIHELNTQLLHKKDENSRLQSEVTSLNVMIAGAQEDRMRQVRELEEGLRRELQQSQDRVRLLEEAKLGLTVELTERKEEVEASHREISDMKTAILRLQERLTKVLEAKQPGSNVSQADLLYVREQLELATQREEKERLGRLEAMKKLSEAEKQWDEASELFEANAINNQRQLLEVSQIRNQLQEEVKAKDMVIEDMQAQIAAMEAELNALKSDRDAQDQARLEECRLVLVEEYREKFADVEKKRANDRAQELEKLQMLELKMLEANSNCRRLRNQVQDLRGNIRVFARIRPPMLDESLCLTPDPDGTSLQIVKSRDDSGKDDYEHGFTFDGVFGPEISQEHVFTEVSEFVQSALDGYRVCLFAYGQTGSGKTHTLLGGDGDDRGIIPRAMEQVAEYKRVMGDIGWVYEMQVSFVEIYNEKVRDLLKSSGNIETEPELDVRYQNEIPFLPDATMTLVDPDDRDQLDRILAKASSRRSTAKTAMNEHSSRSHAIFNLHLTGFNALLNKSLEGQLSLVDLAGSERVGRSNVSGQQLTEAKNINQSLSQLSLVFSAIASKSPHVPYRNSQLTKLLQPALSGSGKTIMIVNLGPEESSAAESLSSLRFAKTVSQCEVGPALKMIKNGGGDNKVGGSAKKSNNSTKSPMARGSSMKT